jgi:hypothetical protein
MEGIGILIVISFLFTFGVPLLFLIIGLTKRKHDKKTSNLFFIMGTVWLVIGGGICASILGG